MADSKPTIPRSVWGLRRDNAIPEWKWCGRHSAFLVVFLSEDDAHGEGDDEFKPCLIGVDPALAVVSTSVDEMTSLQMVIEGMHILSKYCNDTESGIAAGDDDVFAGPDLQDNEVNVTDEGEAEYIGSRISPQDLVRLNDLGWGVDAEKMMFYRFV